MTQRNDAAPDWALVKIHSLEPEAFPRVIVALGFDRLTPPMPRGGVQGFEPTYSRHRSWRVRYHDSACHAAKGWRANAWSAKAVEQHDACDAAERQRIGAFNRALCHRPVRLAIRDGATRDCVWIDETSGEWAHANGGAHGEDLIALGAFMLGCRYGQAAYRIARACGLPGLPTTRKATA